MKKLLRNKRMFLTLVAGLLVFVAVLGAGTFAWFTARAEADATAYFGTAKIDLEMSGFNANGYNIYPHVEQKDYQLHLEGLLTDPNPVFEFNKWLFDMKDDAIEWNESKVWQFNEYDAMKTGPVAGKLNLIRNPFGRITAPANDPKYFAIGAMTPGSLLEVKYDLDIKTLASTSTVDLTGIPVYLRVNAFELFAEPFSGGGAPVKFEMVQTLVANISGVLMNKPFEATVPFVRVTDPNGVDWFYLPTPLLGLDGNSSTTTELQICMTGYIFGEANGNDLQDKMIWVNSLAKDEHRLAAEIIQGTNNAVHLADGWSGAAALLNGEFFIPYVSEDKLVEYYNDVLLSSYYLQSLWP